MRTGADLQKLVGCTQLGGSLDISGAAIESLAELSALSSISGHLKIVNCPNLTDTAGLDKLERIGGGLLVDSNDALVELKLPRLQGVAGEEITISYNPGLARVEFPLLSDANTLALTGNPKLATLDFENLAELHGSLFVLESTFANFAGFETLGVVGGSVNVKHNTGLLTFSGLNALTSIAGDLMVEDNSALTALELPALVEVGGGTPSSSRPRSERPAGPGPRPRAQIYVSNNPSLTTVAMSALKSVGAVRVVSNSALPQCQAEALAAQAGLSCQCEGNGAGECTGP